MLLQKLADDIPIHDSNFLALIKNLESTTHVAKQLPQDLAEKCNSDVDAYATDIEELQKRWEDVKAKLMALSEDVKVQLPQMEKGALTVGVSILIFL